MTLALASQVIGFISFCITLMTLLGVYRDLISTMRTANTTIPLMLGNLRQELEEERALLRYRYREGDRYDVFPSLRKRTRKQTEVASLLRSTIDRIWQEFRNVERPFLIKNPIRAEQGKFSPSSHRAELNTCFKFSFGENKIADTAFERTSVKKGDYWGESDLDEKVRGRSEKLRDHMDAVEAGLQADPQQRYYRTDVAHRFIWWQSQSAVISLLDQVQRIQIRRIERDVFETDELVKRCLDRLEGRGGGGRRRSGSGSPGSGGGGRGGIRRRSVRSRPGSVRLSSRRGSAASGHFGEVDERETVRPRPEGEASNTGRRRERSPRPHYEYEIVQPGRIFVDVDEGEAQRRPRMVPGKSYNRERPRGRYPGNEGE